MVFIEGLNSSGIHPGKPVIWARKKSPPSVPPEDYVELNEDLEEVTPGRRDIYDRGGQGRGQDGEAYADSASIKAASRPNDPGALLDDPMIGYNTVKETIQQYLSQYGVSSNMENLETVLKGLKGQYKPALLESAILLLAKGLPINPDGVIAIARLLNRKTPSIQQQIEELDTAFHNGKDALAAGLKDPVLIGLQQLIPSIRSHFQQYLSQSQNPNQWSQTDLSEMLQLLSVLKQFLRGLEQTWEQKISGCDTDAVLKWIGDLKGPVQALTRTFAAQSILSGLYTTLPAELKDQFIYRAYPNSMDPRHNIECVMSRPTSRRKRAYLQHSRILLRFETQSLGAIGIDILIENKKIAMVLYVSSSEARKLLKGIKKDLSRLFARYHLTLGSYRFRNSRLFLRGRLFPKLPKGKARHVNTITG